MRFRSYIAGFIAAGVSMCAAQVSSHAPVASHAPAVSKPAGSTPVATQISAMAAKPVARVNGAVLTEIDIQREIYMMFPYAQQHGGAPKSMEAEIRKGAMDMIIFEELLYQEAKRRNMQISPARLAKAETAFRQQFPDKSVYEQYLKVEFNGSPKVLREKIRRSLLIEKMLKTEVNQKAKVTLAAAKVYYDKNSKQFERGETIAIQTISIIPPDNAPKAVQDEARAKIKDIVRLGRNAKTSRDFGLIAEQLSDDDWRTKLGDRGTVEVSKYPPPIVEAARKMKPGDVSDVIQLGNAYVVFRLNAHTPAGKTPFEDVKAKLQSDMQKEKLAQIRRSLYQKLRAGATIEVL